MRNRQALSGKQQRRLAEKLSQGAVAEILSLESNASEERLTVRRFSRRSQRSTFSAPTTTVLAGMVSFCPTLRAAGSEPIVPLLAAYNFCQYLVEP